MKHSLLVTILAVFAGAQPAWSQTDLGPLNLPTGSVGLPWTEGFELFPGTVPPYMALTNLDAASLTPDVEAWCNLGQIAPCLNPWNGSYNLEMGLEPNITNYHDVRNAMVMLIDPTGYTGPMTMSAAFIDGGEETDPVDGIWVSSDGTNWYAVALSWGTTVVPDNAWEYLDDFRLDSTVVDTSQPFYLAFVQEDNFPYLDLDGIGIDDISIPAVPAPPEFSISNAVAGQYATLQVESGYFGVNCKFLASLVGPGPTTLANGTIVSLSRPIIEVSTVVTDSRGIALDAILIPASLVGADAWLQAIVLTGLGTEVSNSLNVTIQ